MMLKKRLSAAKIDRTEKIKRVKGLSISICPFIL